MSGPTERLYYLDPTLTEFEARVASVTRVGDHEAVTLDRTAFYPTSGGQPFDTGSLGEATVIEVVENEAGDILHVLDRPIPAGQAVRGRIDPARRLDHMQQHTGQHILSSALDRLAHARTVGFHLGAEVSTVDLDIPLSPQAIAAAEDDANRVVWEDRVVSIRMVSEADAGSLPLRKETGRTGTLRVIEVEGYDCSACGGTHVTRTGSVGMIAVLSAERLRGGARLEFVCGGRALRQMRTYRDAVAGCIRSISVAPADLPAAIERLQAEAKEQRKLMRDMQERLAVHEAREIAGQAEILPDGTRLVARVVETADQNVLKAMALAVCAGPGYRVVLLSSAAPHLVVVARSKEVGADAGAAVKSLFARFGGRGGGRPDLAQGGGLNGPADDVLAHARAALVPG